MPGFHNFSRPNPRHQEDPSAAGPGRLRSPGNALVKKVLVKKALGSGAAAAVAILLAGCGAPQAALTAGAGTAGAGTAGDTASATSTASPSATPIANRPCTAVNTRQVNAGISYICTRDESGVLVWLDADQSRRITDKIAAAEAAKAAANKAAADKAAADKAAADKAAADKAAADKAAADAAAARQAAEAKAAQDAAAAKAAQDAAAKAAAPPAPAPAVPGTNPGCDPNYSGCVPIASDVDCAGGSGNGPAYVRGPIQVIGRDIYGLDADHDGLACER